MHGFPSALLFALAVVCGPASATLLSVTGEARDPASGRLLYREDHLIRETGPAPTARVVLYRCADGTPFARKRVDYAPSATAPSFTLTDARDGYREGLQRSGGRATTFSGKKTGTVPSAGDALVADAGFDEFLRRRWDTLVGKGAMPFEFVVPSFGKALDFRVASLGRQNVDGTAVQAFRLKLDGMLGLVAPTIDVAYDAADKRLRRFTGVSNIRSDAGENLKARIDFANKPVDAPEASWQAAIDAPLKKCAVGG